MKVRLVSVAGRLARRHVLILVFAAVSLFGLVFACSSSPSAEEARADAARRALLEKITLPIPLGSPLVVRGDVKVPPGEFVRPALGAEGRQGVLVATGVKNATIDLTGVDLRGTGKDTSLDQNVGFGLVLDGCENVTVRGGKLGGYKDCIVARKCKNLVIDGVQFDGWYGMNLHSTSAAEDPGDWLYPHENDKDEWIQNYGSAIALTDCTGSTVKGCRGRHGQNGILLTRCSDSRVYDDDFSFLSGWGLAMYRSSKNVVSHNVFDYCVRGYSHGVYWRGQDSAGILMFERCSDNLFAENSATHGGDGVFLFAGNDTVLGRAFDKGEADAGGSDRNIWFKNDFSFAVANAIEATFSADNWAIENQLGGSHQHGVWGGYSSRMVILKNDLSATQGGAISIEHGQDCAIADNTIEKNDIGVELWWNENKDLVEGPFGKHRDTSSRDHWVSGNTFAENVQDVVLKKTSGVAFSGNHYPTPNRVMYVDKLETTGGPAPKNVQVKDWMAGEDGSRPSGHVSDSSLQPASEEPAFLKKARKWKCPDVPGTLNAFAGEKRGLDSIVIGEWGPWDWRSGEPRPKMRVIGGELADAKWDAIWFSWRDSIDPRTDATRWRKLSEEPLVQKTVRNFVNPWGGDEGVKAKVRSDHFGLLATTHFKLREGGRFRATVLSDDGVRLSIDKRQVLENWTWHAPTRDDAEVELAAGEHTVELEYFQIDGAMALLIELERVVKP